MSSKRLRIAVWHNLPSGGGKRALYDHVRGLIGRGHEVEIWCPEQADREYLPLSDLATEHRLPMDRSVSTRRFTLDSVFHNQRAMRQQLRAARLHAEQCAAEMAGSRFDVLFANSCQFHAASCLARCVDLPSVLYLQEPFRHLYEARPEWPWAMEPDEPSRSVKARLKAWSDLQALRLQAREERANAAAFDRLLVNSQFSRESVARAYGLDARVCYLGVDSDLFQPTGVERGNHVIGCGSIHPPKGVDLAIQAVSGIDEAARPKLIWVANQIDDKHRNEVECLAVESGVEFSVRHLIPDRELIDLLSTAVAMIYTARLEPFGFAPLEANACGAPVVAVAEGGVRETVRDGFNGLSVSNRDPNALAQALCRLIDNQELARTMGRQGRQMVLRDWSDKAAVARLEGFLLRTVERANDD